MFGDWRIHNQERRASARRGSVRGRACRAERIMFSDHRPPNQEPRSVSPPWYGNRTGSTERFLSNEDGHMPRGAYAPPLLVVLRYGHLPTKLRLVRYTNARLQQRRPSARRGSVTLRAHRAEGAIFGQRRPPHQDRRTVSPPWFGNRTCNGDRFSWSDYIHHARSDGAPRLPYANRSRRRS